MSADNIRGGKEPIDTHDEKEEIIKGDSENWWQMNMEWGSSWFDSMKEKTVSTLSMMKKDLCELSDIVATEASTLADVTVDSLNRIVGNTVSDEQSTETDSRATEEPNSLSQSNGTDSIDEFGWGSDNLQLSKLVQNKYVQSFVRAVQRFGYSDTADEENLTIRIRAAPSNNSYSSYLSPKDLNNIRVTRSTYSTEPVGDEKLYEMWKDKFDLMDHLAEIEYVRQNCPTLCEIYADLVKLSFLYRIGLDLIQHLSGPWPLPSINASLLAMRRSPEFAITISSVPSTISDLTFWQRLYFKIRQAELIAHCDKELSNENFESKEETVPDSPIKSSRMNSSKCSITDETWSVISGCNIEIEEIKDDGD